MDPIVLRLVAVVALLGVVAVAGTWWRRRDGRVRIDESGATPRLSVEELGAVGLNGGERPARALLFSAPSCSPCRTVKDVLGEVSATRGDFDWAVVDAGDHLELARRHRVLRVPTLFVIGRDGSVVARTSGVPDKNDLLDVLDRHAPTS